MLTIQTKVSASNINYDIKNHVNEDKRVQILNHGNTFSIANRKGDIFPLENSVQGIYHRDTRYVNKLLFLLEGTSPVLLSSNIKEENELLSIDLINNTLTGIPKGILHIHRSQIVREGYFHEKIEFHNFYHKKIKSFFSLIYGGDFKDIFEVRGIQRKKTGKHLGYDAKDTRKSTFKYKGLDNITRTCIFNFSHEKQNIPVDDGIGALFDLNLSPQEKFLFEYSISFFEGEKIPAKTNFFIDIEAIRKDLKENRKLFPEITTSNEQFNHWINRSKTDLTSLLANVKTGKYPYAGVPWYNTAFGRDGLITGLETLWLAPQLSRDILLFLAENQAVEEDKYKDAEPGKILHETRNGELVNLNEVPFKQYYGTIDATPLFVILAGKYYERTADISTIKSIWPALKRATEWMEKYGDLDQDGFIEYQHKAENGLTNQGWKDSFDSVFYENGKLAQPPIALCEVQGYAYMARILMSSLALAMDERDYSTKLKHEAIQIKKRFNEKFWDEELGMFVLALDRHKRPCRVKTSNAGHALYTGIADKDKAKILVNSLLKPDMYSGWGIRTLSKESKKYNPMSYHNGSVWPHDVALIAAGMSHYGFQKDALKVMTGLFDASLFIPLQRLPELFCGFDRRKGEGLSDYPVACSPQAWSVSAVFLLLESILKISINPFEKVVKFENPVLPEYLEEIKIKGLKIDEISLNIEIKRFNMDQMVGINFDSTNTGWKLNVIK